MTYSLNYIIRATNRISPNQIHSEFGRGENIRRTRMFITPCASAVLLYLPN